MTTSLLMAAAQTLRTKKPHSFGGVEVTASYSHIDRGYSLRFTGTRTHVFVARPGAYVVHYVGGEFAYANSLPEAIAAV